MSAPSAPPRLLCLPGYGSNADGFERSLAQVRRMMKGAVEFVFAQPPLVLLPPNLVRSAEGVPSPSTADTPRSWWRAELNNGFTSSAELSALVRYLREIIETQGPLDGVWGLNQGAAVASILAALIAEPSLHPVFNSPSPSLSTAWPPSQLKFIIMCSGYLPLDRRLESWFSRPLNVPSLHILGRSDEIVIPERGLANVARFKGPRVEWHDEKGGVLPRSASWSFFFKEFITVHSEGGEGLPRERRIVSPSLLTSKL